MSNQNQLVNLENILRQDLINKGVISVILIDMAGNIVANLDDASRQADIYSLSCLAAGSYGVVKTMANLIGEGDFCLLFHKGKNVSIHFKTITSEYLLINIFNKELSLGFLRLKVTEAVKKIRQIPHLFIAEESHDILVGPPSKRLAVL